MDVVIPYRHNESKWAGNELRYCLRALEKNFKDLGQVIIVGDSLPDWIKKDSIAWFVKVGDPLLRNKDGNIINKILYAINQLQEFLSQDFMFLSDDQLFWKETSIEDIDPYYLPLMPTVIRGRYQWRMKNTMDILKSRGKSWFNYESHLPVIYNCKKFVEVMSTFPYDVEGEGITINTAYFNSVLRSHQELPNNIRAAFEREEHAEKNKERLNTVRYVSYNDNGLTFNLKKIISKKFEEISKFEESF